MNKYSCYALTLDVHMYTDLNLCKLLVSAQIGTVPMTVRIHHFALMKASRTPKGLGKSVMYAIHHISNATKWFSLP